MSRQDWLCLLAFGLVLLAPGLFSLTQTVNLVL